MLRNILYSTLLIATSAQSAKQEDVDRFLSNGNCNGCDLTGADLHGKTITVNELTESKLDGADLRGIELRANTISGNDFGSANLEGASIWVTQFRKNTFKAANLNKAIINNASGHGLAFGFFDNEFRSSTLINARLDTDICYHSQFYDSDLSGFQLFSYGMIRYCNAWESKLDGSFWSGVLTRQNFVGCSALKAYFSIRGEQIGDVFFRDSDLRGARIDKELSNSYISFENTQLEGAMVTGVVCTAASTEACVSATR